MPLHEWLERKRRSQIDRLNAAEACHICESTNRTSHDPSSPFHESHSAPGTMRTCGCYGTPPGDECHWPYSLRVCELCLRDDARTGRIRCCGICGAVACDDLCGVELVECTDSDEWNNAGCLECRRMESFSEIDLFRTPSPATTSAPRATRVCTKCLAGATPWVKFDFVCRRFKCETHLVPSDVVERKRFSTFVSSPLNALPEDSIDSIIDFLAGEDLGKLYTTCSALCVVAERVAKDKVVRMHGEFPSGPINTEKKERIYPEGKFPDRFLAVPEDGKSWVGLFYYLEKITHSSFYFGFQTAGGDKDAASRFLQKSNKFAFGQIFTERNGRFLPGNATCPGIPRLSPIMRGGQIMVPENLPRTPVLATSSQVMSSGSGIHRIIFRLFCPGSGASRNFERLGSVGIIKARDAQRGLVASSWARQINVWENLRNEEYVVGMEFDAHRRVLVVHQLDRFRFGNGHAGQHYTIEESVGCPLQFAVELSAKGVSTKGAQLSVRKCSAEEWESFVAHSSQLQTEAAPLRAREIERFGIARLEELFDDDDDEGQPPRNLAEVIEDHEINHVRFPPNRIRIRMARMNRALEDGNRNEDDANNNNPDNNGDVRMIDLAEFRVRDEVRMRERLRDGLRDGDPDVRAEHRLHNARLRHRFFERVQMRERGRNRENNNELNVERNRNVDRGVDDIADAVMIAADAADENAYGENARET